MDDAKRAASGRVAGHADQGDAVEGVVGRAVSAFGLRLAHYGQLSFKEKVMVNLTNVGS